MKTMSDAQLSAREIFVETQMQIAEDFSDGAFWGFMEEHGIEVDEVVAVVKKDAAEENGEAS